MGGVPASPVHKMFAILSAEVCTVYNTVTYTDGWIPGVVQGVRTPLFGPICRLFDIGPKLDPLLDPGFFACRPRMDPPPLLFKNPGSAPVQCIISKLVREARKDEYYILGTIN